MLKYCNPVRFRRRNLMLAVYCLLCIGAAAQRTYAPDFALGVKGGMTLSEMGWQPSVQQSFTPGTTFGIVARYTEEKHFGIIGELNITQTGWAEKFDSDSPLAYSRHFTYLQLPVMTHIYFGRERFKGFVNLGPQVGYMIGNHISANFNYTDATSVANWPANHRSEQLAMEPQRKVDYGIVGGLGAEMRMARKHSILVEARFYFGIANVFAAGRSATFGASRNLNFAFTAAYLFRLK